jgi:hypothetical protein
MVRFLHVRECDEWGELLNFGGCTVAYTVSPELNTIFVHLAICSDKDHFVKKIGRDIAADRLKNDKQGPLALIELNSPYSEAVRLWVMEYFDIGLIKKGKIWVADREEIPDATFPLDEIPNINVEDAYAEQSAQVV